MAARPGRGQGLWPSAQKWEAHARGERGSAEAGPDAAAAAWALWGVVSRKARTVLKRARPEAVAAAGAAAAAPP